jgi:hypothetical protein
LFTGAGIADFFTAFAPSFPSAGVSGFFFAAAFRGGGFAAFAAAAAASAAPFQDVLPRGADADEPLARVRERRVGRAAERHPHLRVLQTHRRVQRSSRRRRLQGRSIRSDVGVGFTGVR